MVTIRISNMNCGGCAKGVTATLNRFAGEMPVRIDLATREATMGAPDTTLDTEAIIAALRADGWNAEAKPG